MHDFLYMYYVFFTSILNKTKIISTIINLTCLSLFLRLTHIHIHDTDVSGKWSFLICTLVFHFLFAPVIRTAQRNSYRYTILLLSTWKLSTEYSAESVLYWQSWQGGDYSVDHELDDSRERGVSLNQTVDDRGDRTEVNNNTGVRRESAEKSSMDPTNQQNPVQSGGCVYYYYHQ